MTSSSIFNASTSTAEIFSAWGSRAEGKTILITGTSAGSIGAQVAIAFATAQPAHILLVGRTASKMPKLEGAKSTFIPCDLRSQESVRRAAADISVLVEKVDIFINCAGIMALATMELTREGIEAQFGVNHIAHFLLTNLLVSKARPDRVVNVSSTGFKIGPVHYDDVNWGNGERYHPWKGYGSSKTANCLFSVGLAQRGVEAVTVHPGQPKTNLITHVDAATWAKVYELMDPEKPVDQTGDHKTLDQSAAMVIDAALNPEYGGANSGVFVKNCGIYDDIEEWARKPEDAEMLWKLSEELVGQRFDI